MPFEWKEENQLSFQTLIKKLTTQPILAYADCRLSFSVQTDASLNGLGAVLYQKQDICNLPSEKYYPAHKLEFLALKWVICEKLETLSLVVASLRS